MREGGKESIKGKLNSTSMILPLHLTQNCSEYSFYSKVFHSLQPTVTPTNPLRFSLYFATILICPKCTFAVEVSKMVI